MSESGDNPYASPSAATRPHLSSADRELLVVLLELRSADYVSIACRSFAKTVFNVPFAALLSAFAAFVAYLAVGSSPATLWATGIALFIATMIGSFSRDLTDVVTLFMVRRAQICVTDYPEVERLLYASVETEGPRERSAEVSRSRPTDAGG